MSVHVSSRVWKLRLNPVQKLVMLKLADCADDEGRNAWPAWRKIGRECCIARATVARAIDALRAAGLIIVQEDGPERLSVTYELHPERGESLSETRLSVTPPPSQSETPPRLTVRRAPVSDRDPPRLTVRPKTSMNRPTDPSSSKPSMNRPPLTPPQAGGDDERAARAKEGSRRKRDVDAMRAGQTTEERYLGAYGAAYAERQRGRAK